MAERKNSRGLHSEVQEIPSLCDLSVRYAASAKEQASFEAAIFEHRAFVISAANAFGFDGAELTVVHEPTQSIARFVGLKANTRFVFSESRFAHPEYGLGADRVVHLIVDLLAKIRMTEHQPFGAPALKLYWVADPLHEDDWFVVARTARDARRFFAYDCGDDVVNSNACTRIATLPPAMQKVDDEVFNIVDDHCAGWPSHETICACGGSFDEEEQPRIVRLKGRIFREGGLDAVIERAARIPREPRRR
jgi:hypothetical protein